MLTLFNAVYNIFHMANEITVDYFSVGLSYYAV